MVVELGQQYHVGEKYTVILYTYINRHAGTPNKTKMKDTMSLDYSSVCKIGSRVVWVSMKDCFCLKKNLKTLNASRLSEHPPVRGKRCQNV